MSQERAFLRNVGLVLLQLSLLLHASCGGQSEPDALRIGVLPILDTLPVFVAAQEGAFARRDVRVELVSVASAAERDQLLQAGRLDGIITDLVALALYNRDVTRVVAVRYAMKPTAAFPQFRVMAAQDSALSRPTDLAHVPIGVSEGTIIEYVTQRMLEAEGLSENEITTVAVPKIPERMALLRSGELQAATLPEPLASLALQDGATVILDDTKHIDISCSVYAFRSEALEGQPGAVRGFLAAVSEASAAVNSDKTRWNGLLAEKNLVPEPLIGSSYELPDYPGDQVPAKGQFEGTVDWLIKTSRLSEAPAYPESINGSFLP